MKKNLREEVEIPEGAEVAIEGNMIKLKLGNVELKRAFKGIIVKKEDGKIVVMADNATKKEKKLINTTISHIKNMFTGLKGKYIYKLQICSVHFPMNVSVDKANKELIIKNYLGEKYPRKAKILSNVDAKVEKDIITLESNDKESAGQTAANIERATHLNNRDRRRYQDGIWIVSKAGKDM